MMKTYTFEETKKNIESLVPGADFLDVEFPGFKMERLKIDDILSLLEKDQAVSYTCIYENHNINGVMVKDCIKIALENPFYWKDEESGSWRDQFYVLGKWEKSSRFSKPPQEIRYSYNFDLTTSVKGVSKETKNIYLYAKSEDDALYKLGSMLNDVWCELTSYGLDKESESLVNTDYEPSISPGSLGIYYKNIKNEDLKPVNYCELLR